MPLRRAAIAILLLFASTTVELAAQSARDACADAARALVRQETRWDEGRFGASANVLRWRAANGTRGICRLDRRGRVDRVEVEQWAADDIVIGLPGGGYAGLTEEPGYDRRGDDYTSFDSRSLDDCKNACQRDSRCRAYTYDQDDRHCWLKSGTPSAQPHRNRVTGVKTEGPPAGGGLTEERGFDRRGDDYNSFRSGSLESCQNLCARESRCRAYSYEIRSGTCWLKSRINSRQSASDFVTGYKPD